MFNQLRKYTAVLIYNQTGTYDDDGNYIEGSSVEIEIKCSIQNRLDNKKLTSSNLENKYSFAVFTDIINYLPITNFKIKIDNIVYDVVHLINKPSLNYCKILVK